VLLRKDREVIHDFSRALDLAGEDKVEADAIAPLVQVNPSVKPVALGQSVTLYTSATDNVGVKFLNLTVNGKAVTIDANGLYTFTPDKVGTINAVATAIDAAGNQSTATTTFDVIDFSDITAPVVKLPSLSGTTITSPTEIVGTVTDDNLLYYTLSVAQSGTNDFQEIFRGTNTVSDGVLGSFDPSLLQNDAYTLRLTAVDKGGNNVFVEETVNISGSLKLGNFQLSFTDLTLPVSGIPITVTRTYDTLTSSTRDDFGYGWRLEFRDTDLRTSLGRDEQNEIFGKLSKGFKAGDKVYITLRGEMSRRAKMYAKATIIAR
jgi:large repetitive protein